MMQKPTTFEEYVKRGLRVLLLDGFNRQVLPMAEHLHRLGICVATLSTSRLDPGYASRWPRERYLGPDPRDDTSGLLDLVRTLLESKDFDVVIAHEDETAEALARSKKVLSQFTNLAVNDLTVLNRGRDKLLTMQACAELELPHPRTLDAALPDLPDRARSMDLDVPLVLKPRKADGAMGFTRVDRLTDLPELVRDVTNKFGPALVQEYIPQTDLQYKCDIVLDQRGKVCSSVVYSKIRWFPLQGGSSVLNATVRRPDIQETSLRLLRGIGWRGYGDVDLIDDPRDGRAKVMEVNPRITAPVRICFDAGVNFARQIVEDALGLPVTAYPEYETGRYLRYMHTDILWFLLSSDRWRAKPSWFSFRRTTDQIFSFRDPLPAMAYSVQASGKLRKWLRKRKTGN